MSRKFVWLIASVLVLTTLACGTSAPQGDDSSAAGNNGQQMFQKFGCAGCHADSDQGPSLAGIYGEQVTLEGGETVTVDEDYLRESILDPGAKVVQGYPPIMPSFEAQLDEEEISALIEHIRSLK